MSTLVGFAKCFFVWTLGPKGKRALWSAHEEATIRKFALWNSNLHSMVSSPPQRRLFLIAHVLNAHCLIIYASWTVFSVFGTFAVALKFLFHTTQSPYCFVSPGEWTQQVCKACLNTWDWLFAWLLSLVSQGVSNLSAAQGNRFRPSAKIEFYYVVVVWH